MNKSNSIKCSNCNLVNFASAPFCKRCRNPFQNFVSSGEGNTVNININLPSSVESVNINSPENERSFNRANQPQFEPYQPNQNQSQEFYNSQNQLGFQQWQQMNAPAFPHPHQMLSSGVFRQGKEIVVHRNAVMPDRCVKCNDYINTGAYARQKYRWHNPLVYIALISPLIYLILAAVLSQRAVVDIPLCHKHLEDRKSNGKYLLNGGVLAAILIFFFGSMGSVGFAFLLFFIALFGLLIAYEYVYKPLQVSKIENDYIYLKGADDEYLSHLPYC